MAQDLSQASPNAGSSVKGEVQGQPLRQLADANGVELGVQCVLAALDAPLWDPQYAKVLPIEYNLLLIDGEIGWGSQRGVYDLSGPDRLVEYAANNGMRVQAHHLIWGHEQFLPSWLASGVFSRTEMLSIMEERIFTLAGHFRGKVHEWSVVNEALYGSGFIQNVWLKSIGSQYIDQAFIWAREADPKAILIYNDSSNEGINSQSDHMYDMTRQMKASGTPIDAVGMQMHLDGSKPPKKADVLANMKRFGELGVRVFVTEFDVDMSGVPGTNTDRQAIQAKIYSDMLDASLESGACNSFTVFGLNDRVSWGFSKAMAEPLPIDGEYNRKPAYIAMQQSLSKKRIYLPLVTSAQP